MTPHAHDMNDALAEKVASASPEEFVAMLLGAGQRFLAQAIQAMIRQDYAARGQALGRVAAIVEELASRLNHQDGGELVTNLSRIYGWWAGEITLAGEKLDPERLEKVSRVMGDLKETWEQLHRSRIGAGRPGPLQLAASLSA
jgi:flagellar protein FliS